MKTELEINKNILETTVEIEEEFPKLLKLIEGMPITIPDENAPKINAAVLEEYQESLNSLLKKYTINHHQKNKHHDSN